MGTENISKTELLGKIDDMSMKIDLAFALVDLIAEVDPESLSKDTIRRASFHLRDLLEEVREHHRLLSKVATQK